MQIRRLCSVAGIVLAFVACGHKPKVKEAPSGVGLQTEVIESGAEPREKLRYQRAPGLTENLVIELALGGVVDDDAADDDAENADEGNDNGEAKAGHEGVPVLALGLTMGAVTQVEQGVWRYPFAFRLIGVRMPEGSTQADVELVNRLVAPLGDVTGVFEVDDRGLTRRADVVVPPEVSPRLLALLGNIRTSLISVPLPEEPVGVGARWQVQRLHKVGNIQTMQTMTYSLLEREARVLRLGVTLRQSAAPQEVSLGDDTKIQVEAYEVTGTGSMLMSLDAITPLGEMRGTSDLRALLRRGSEAAALHANGAVEVIVMPVGSATEG